MFFVPNEVSGAGIASVEFLDEDTLFYFNFDKPDAEEGKRKSVFEIYGLSPEERQDLEVTGNVEWGRWR